MSSRIATRSGFAKNPLLDELLNLSLIDGAANYSVASQVIDSAIPNVTNLCRRSIKDCITDGLSRRCEPPIFGAATLYGLSQEQFSRGAVIERHGRSRPATKFVLLGYTFVWLVGVLNTSPSGGSV